MFSKQLVDFLKRRSFNKTLNQHNLSEVYNKKIFVNKTPVYSFMLLLKT